MKRKIQNEQEFLSTPSARRATFFGTEEVETWIISIHALREEGDAIAADMTGELRQFLSTPSARRATGAVRHLCRLQRISIHALREEGDVPGS